jgi:septation ring formation regulator EzrA
MTINQIILHDYQTESAIVLAIVVILLTVYVYVSDIRRERDIRIWEEYKRKRSLEARGLDKLINREKEQGS